MNQKKTIIVSRSIVDQNHNMGSFDPVFTITDSSGEQYKSSDILIMGPCSLQYDPAAPEGQRVWIETFSKIITKNGIDSETGNPIMAAI